MSKWLDKVIEIAEELEWSVEQECDNVYDFGKYSPAGQDFHTSIDTENDFDYFLSNLNAIISDFDVSEEAYVWLDSSGHGTNGAPYDMKDVYEDMEACLENLEELRDALKCLEFDEDEEDEEE